MNEGFRALPPEVQKKILGKAMGGAMQRPLFRQMGGPAEPMPQEMVQQAESEGQMLGEEIAQRTVQSIDEATDVEGAINALRGNDMPLDARYQELAGFVGERDAAQTPESVLALTQPAMMMTETGAMDSGIGELMQSIAGDTQMDAGMDEGLGALMMQGAGNTPPENFNQGGPVAVQYFSQGKEAVANRDVPVPRMAERGAFDTYLQRATDARKDILGTPEERAAQLERAQQQARSDAAFNLANFGLAFAGETQGGTVAERLANAAARSQLVPGLQQAGKDVEAIRREQETQDQAMRMSALEAAELSERSDTEQNFELFKMFQQTELNLKEASEANELAKTNAKTAQGYAIALEKQRQATSEAVANINAQSSTDVANINKDLQESLQNKRATLEKELTELNAENDLFNRLQVMGAQYHYDTGLLDDKQEHEEAMQKSAASIESIAREDQQSFTAAQNALQRMLTRAEKTKDRAQTFNLAELERELTDEHFKAGLRDKALDRAVQVNLSLISNALEKKQLVQGDKQLALQEARDAVEAQYKAKSLAIDEAAAKIKAKEVKNSDDNLVYLTGNVDETDTRRIDAFLNKEMSAEEASKYESRLLRYTSPGREWNESTKSFTQTPGLRLSQDIEEKLKDTRPDLYEKVSGQKAVPAEPIELDDQTKSILFKDVVDPAKAFGSPGFVRDILNKGLEAFSYGKWGAPYDDTKEAIVAVDNLNSEFVNFFTQASEIRESVFQQQKLEMLTPKAGEFWQGQSEATSKATALLRRIQQAEELVVTRMNSREIPTDGAAYSKLDKQLKQLGNLRAGYQVLSNMAESLNEQNEDDQKMFNDLMDKFNQ